MSRIKVTAGSGALLRVLGVPFGLAAMVGGMVGAGILRNPGVVAGAVGTEGRMIMLWAIGAVFVGITSLAYVELGSAIPCAGGPYDFVRRAFGPFAGIATGWGAWLVMVVAQAYLAVVVAEFLQRLGIGADLSASVLGIMLLALFWLVNLTGTRLSGASQILFSTVKGLVLIAVVVLLFAEPGRAPDAGSSEIAIGLAGLAVAMKVIVGTYSGWQDIVHFCEEFERPERTLLRSMVLGVAGVAILYLLVNGALLHVLTPAQMARSTLPAADAATLLFGNFGEVALTAFGVLSVSAITNLVQMKSARISFALGRDGILPRAFGTALGNGTPAVALTVNVFLAMLFASTGGYLSLLATTVGLNAALFALVNASAIRLRRTEPDLGRPFRVPFHPLPQIAAILLNFALLTVLIIEDPLHTLLGFMILCLISLGYLAGGRVAHARRSSAASKMAQG